MRAKLHFIKEAISWVLLITMIVLFSLTMYQVVTNPNKGEGAFVFGYRPNLTLTGSMEPYMLTNSIFISKEVHDINEIEEGDVISFLLPTEEGNVLRIAHRIISIDEDGNIKTKGDNNRVEDNFTLTMDNVESRVVCVINLTAWIAAKWQTTVGKVMLISFAFAIISGYILIKKAIVSAANSLLDKIDGKTTENTETTEAAEVLSEKVEQ